MEVLLPGFLTSMIAGILIGNLVDVVGVRVNQAMIDRAGEISLNLFLSMSLMAMQLLALADSAGPILTVVVTQMLVITLFVVWIVFRAMGKDYDAAVISSGFAGLGLGATPVAIAKMSAITGRYGPSPKAFLVVPLIGAFFIDILNAGIIRLFGQMIVRRVGLLGYRSVEKADPKIVQQHACCKVQPSAPVERSSAKASSESHLLKRRGE